MPHSTSSLGRRAPLPVPIDFAQLTIEPNRKCIEAFQESGRDARGPDKNFIGFTEHTA